MICMRCRGPVPYSLMNIFDKDFTPSDSNRKKTSSHGTLLPYPESCTLDALRSVALRDCNKHEYGVLMPRWPGPGVKYAVTSDMHSL